MEFTSNSDIVTMWSRSCLVIVHSIHCVTISLQFWDTKQSILTRSTNWRFFVASGRRNCPVNRLSLMQRETTADSSDTNVKSPDSRLWLMFRIYRWSEMWIVRIVRITFTSPRNFEDSPLNRLFPWNFSQFSSAKISHQIEGLQIR